MRRSNLIISRSLSPFIFIGFLFSSTLLFAQTAQIVTTDSLTREVKNYSVTNHHFDIPVNNISGWNKCTVSAIKDFEFQGLKRARVDMYCYTQQGQLTHFYCTTGKGNIEVVIAQIMATGSKYNPNLNQINATRSLEMLISCNYL
jgi:hypothetical protein